MDYYREDMRSERQMMNDDARNNLMDYFYGDQEEPYRPLDPNRRARDAFPYTRRTSPITPEELEMILRSDQLASL